MTIEKPMSWEAWLLRTMATQPERIATKEEIAAHYAKEPPAPERRFATKRDSYGLVGTKS